MIMKRYFILAAAALLVLPGCSGDRAHIVRTDDMADTLKLQELHLPYEFLMPARMIASCGDVVIYQRKVDDTFVLVDMSDGGNCTVIGRKGRGPGEAAFCLRILPMCHRKTHICFMPQLRQAVA